MPGLRIGIDVGGTFTHGVALRPPGEVVATARTPTTHRDSRGVAAGVAAVLRELIARLAELGFSAGDIELVAHSTTQATNALLEGDVSPVTRLLIVPPGESALVRSATRGNSLDVGNGHRVPLETRYLDWNATGEWIAVGPIDRSPGIAGSGDVTPPFNFDLPSGGETPPLPGETGNLSVAPTQPIAVIQPLAGKQELREQALAEACRAQGCAVVCASEITQVLGLAARARTAVVNAAMLPKMLATAEYTEAAVREVLGQDSGSRIQDSGDIGGAGGSPAFAAGQRPAPPDSGLRTPDSGPLLQVVRSDGGAMSIDEMRRQPILSLLSGPAAGASAALQLSGLSEVVFIEVGGTSTDITLISEGRVRHRYATVGGQRLMVPALDLRTVAVGGGSMLRADKPLFGPRSAHIAGLPYLFQALASGLSTRQTRVWAEGGYIDQPRFVGEIAGVAAFYSGFRRPMAGSFNVMDMSDGSTAAITLTDLWLAEVSEDSRHQAEQELGVHLTANAWGELQSLRALGLAEARKKTLEQVVDAIRELARTHNVDLAHFTLLGGGGGAPSVVEHVASRLGLKSQLATHHTVISAIGAALAVTCVSLNKSVAQPTGADIAELTGEVERRLNAQGAERVSTDYEYDPQRQVLTVTGRGNRPYEQSATPQSAEELARVAEGFIDNGGLQVWDGGDVQLWQAGHTGGAGLHAGQQRMAGRDARPTSRDARPIGKGQLGLALDRFGRSLWFGTLAEFFPAAPGQREQVLQRIVEQRTQYTDGGPLLPGLALLCDGRFIPLDQLGSAELIAEILRLEDLPAGVPGCFVIRG